MPRVEPYYKQIVPFTVNGLTLQIGEWRFSCGAIDPASPAYIFRDLPPTDIAFTQDVAFPKTVTLYVTPVNDGVDNYYLNEVIGDGLHTSNPPTEKWTPDISVVPCLSIIVPKAGDGATLIVTANEFDPGPWSPVLDPWPLPVNPAPNPRRDVTHGGLRVKAWPVGGAPVGWEALDAKKHKKVFPISLGRLKLGENWYVLTPEAEEKLKGKS